MQPVRSILPELHSLRLEGIASPKRWTRYLIRMLSAELFHPLLQISSCRQDPALFRNRRTDLASARSAVEVCIHLCVGQEGDRAFQADLATKAFPVKAHRGMHVVCELLSLFAAFIGEKAEALLRDLLQPRPSTRQTTSSDPRPPRRLRS